MLLYFSFSKCCITKCNLKSTQIADFCHLGRYIQKIISRTSVNTDEFMFPEGYVFYDFEIM